MNRSRTVGRITLEDAVLVEGTPGEVFKRILGALPGRFVLDTATARGGFIDILFDNLPHVEHVVGSDINPELLAEAQATCQSREVDLVVTDAARQGFSDAAFDMVNLSVSLHHMTDIPSVLRDAQRVLKPGGTCVVSEMVRDGLEKAQLSETYLHHWAAEIDRSLGIVHNQTLTRDEILSYIQALPWEEVHLFDHVHPIMEDSQEERIQRIDAAIDGYAEKARDTPEAEKLIQRGEWVRNWVHDHGMERASVLILVCRK